MTARSRKPSARKRLAGKLCIAPPPVGRTLPVAVKDKKMALALGSESLSVFGDADSGSRTISELRSPTDLANTSSNQLTHSSRSDLLSSILDGQELLGKKSEDIEIQKDGQLKLRLPKKFSINLKTTAISLPSSPSATSTSHPTPRNTAHTPELPSSKATFSTGPATTALSFKPVLSTRGELPHSHSSPNLQCASSLLPSGKDGTRAEAATPIGNSINETGGIQTDPLLTVEAELDLDSIPLPTASNTKLYLESIPLPPLPESNSDTQTNHSKLTVVSSLDKGRPADQSSGSGDLDKTNCSLTSIIGELTEVSKLKPSTHVITAYPVSSVKVEGRKIYDSRDREEIITRFKQMADSTGQSTDLEDGEIREDDDEIIILTPPPRSPESVVVLSTDTEDERLNMDKARKQKRSKRKRSRSRSVDRRRRSGTPRNRSSRSRSPRNRSSRNRSPRNRFSRNRLSRNRSQHSPQPIRRRTPIKDRLGYQYRGPDRNRRSRTRSPIRRRDRSPPFNRRRLRSPSPIRRVDLTSPRNGHRNSQQRSRRERSSSKQHSDRLRNDNASSHNVRDKNTSPSRNRHRSRNGPSRRSRSPGARNRQSKSRGRTRSRTPERLPRSVIASRSQSSSLSLAAELEKTSSGTAQENKCRSVSPHTHSSGRSKSSKKAKSKKSKNDSKKRKKKKLTDNDKDGKTKKKKKKVRSKRSTSRVSSDGGGQVVNLLSDEEDITEPDIQIAFSESNMERGDDHSRRSATPMSDVSQAASSADKSTRSLSVERKVSNKKKLASGDDEEEGTGAAAGSAVDKEVDENGEEEESLPAVQSDTGSVSDLVSELGEPPDLDTEGRNSRASSPDVTAERNGDVTVSSTVIDQEELDKQAELQALQVIQLLKNEVADPDVAPPAQPPKSIAQKPLVIDWLIQKLGTESMATPTNHTPTHTPPRVRQSVSKEDTVTTLAASSSYSVLLGEDEELPSSATELSNRQLLDKMVGQERIADEVKIVLKPFYCKNTIDKEEYKHVMRNCVTKIYQKTQGRVNPAKVKDFVEKYVGTVITRRKSSK